MLRCQTIKQYLPQDSFTDKIVKKHLLKRNKVKPQIFVVNRAKMNGNDAQINGMLTQLFFQIFYFRF